jgi:hypothetical protein
MAVPQIDPLPQPPSRAQPNNFAALADAFLTALAAAFPTQANAIATFVNAMAAQAAASAASALNAPGTSATSTTSLTIGAGAKTLAIQTGKAFVVGQFVTIAQTTTPGNWMAGQITAHDATAGSLTVQVLGIGGTGTISDWTIGLSAPMRFFAAAAKDFWAGADGTLVATPAGLAAAAVPQALVDAATITPDLATGLNFTVTLGGNRTLANPANAQPGDSGVFVVNQDGTGGRALAYGSAWKSPGGPASLSTGAGAVDVISYFVVTPTLILCTLVRGLA